MGDKRVPMEAEVQELPEEQPARPDNFYGTSARPKTKRDHSWIGICISLTLIVVSTIYIIHALRQIHVEKQADDWVIEVRMPDTTAATEATVENLELSASGEDLVPIPSREVGSVQLRVSEGGGEILSPSNLYAQVAPAVVCVQVETYYGDYTCSGVVISEDGYVLSATEGLTNATEITVSFSDGSSLPAGWVGEERISGLCLLKVEASGLPTVTFARESELNIGQRIYCICNPYGPQLPNVFFDGMLAASGGVTEGSKSFTLLQTTAQLNSVGYGCPILDSRGLVVGMTTPIGKRLVTGDDPCFAVSAGDLTAAVETFQRSASSDGRWLGLEVADISDEMLHIYGLPGTVWICEIAVGSASYGVLREYDVITEVDGVPVGSVAEFEEIISGYEPGSFAVLTIYRAGRWYSIKLPVLKR